jgi:hypothetical protein
MDGWTPQSSPERGGQAGCEGYKRRKGSKVCRAADTLGHLLAVKVTAADEQERAQVGEIGEHMQQAKGEDVQMAYVGQGCTGEAPARQAQAHGIRLEVVKLAEAKKGFVLLPTRRVVEGSFDWAARFKGLSDMATARVSFEGGSAKNGHVSERVKTQPLTQRFEL